MLMTLSSRSCLGWRKSLGCRINQRNYTTDVKLAKPSVPADVLKKEEVLAKIDAIERFHDAGGDKLELDIHLRRAIRQIDRDMSGTRTVGSALYSVLRKFSQLSSPCARDFEVALQIAVKSKHLNSNPSFLKLMENSQVEATAHIYILLIQVAARSSPVDSRPVLSVLKRLKSSPIRLHLQDFHLLINDVLDCVAADRFALPGWGLDRGVSQANGDYDQAISALCELMIDSFDRAPDARSLVLLLDAYTTCGDESRAARVVEHMRSIGVDNNVEVATKAIRCLFAGKMSGQAMDIMAQMEESGTPIPLDVRLSPYINIKSP